jgi:hypothetical protein
MRALVAAGDLMRAPDLGKYADVNMFHIRARYGQRNQVFRLARSGTRMTTNASCMVDDLGPLNRAALWFFKHESSVG